MAGGLTPASASPAATHQGGPLLVLAAVGSLATKVDTALGALWDG